MRRDPRLDPAPGDVLERSFLTYTVADTAGQGWSPRVRCFVSGFPEPLDVGIAQYRRLMKSARIVSTAAPSEGQDKVGS
jgi:hypothetical protein